MGPTEFSMPVGDDPQEVGVDVLGLDMAPRGTGRLPATGGAPRSWHRG